VYAGFHQVNRIGNDECMHEITDFTRF
jgi:hypothetical protein